MKRHSWLVAIVLLALASITARAETISNWTAPPTWTPSATDRLGGVKSAFDTTYPPLPLIPLPPCRLADTRSGSGFPAGYGPPSITGGAQRTFVVTGQCGIPAGAAAVSFNFTVWAPVTRGDLRVFPAGGAAPLVSTLNWEANILALANAAVAPLGTGGAITVQVDGTGTIDLIVDVNGYYAADVSAALGQELHLTSSGGYTVVADNSNLNGVAVFAHASGSGPSIGVHGVSDGGPTGVGVYGLGSSAAIGVLGNSITGYGVVGQSFLPLSGSAGVFGSNGITSGLSYGVLGANFSTTNLSAGVRGYSYNGAYIGSTSYSPAGVSGESGTGGLGVLGVSNSIGVVGSLTDATTGAILAQAELGVKGGPTTYYGVYSAVGDFGGTGAKYFVEPHTVDPSKVIRYIALEGPESGTYFRGRASTKGGVAVLEVPDHFRMVSDEEGMTVHVTPIGRFAEIWVESRDLSRIVVRSERDVDFDYVVYGVRRAFRNFNPVDEGQEFRPKSADDKLPEGLPAEIKARLVRIGIYRADGTVNMETAERLGWAESWREEAARR